MNIGDRDSTRSTDLDYLEFDLGQRPHGLMRRVVCVIGCMSVTIVVLTVLVAVFAIKAAANVPGSGYPPAPPSDFNWPLGNCSKKVLVVLPSESVLMLRNKTDPSRMFPYHTGYYLDELTIPLMTFIANGFDYDVATPFGNMPSMDDRSNASHYFTSDQQWRQALNFVNSSAKIANPIKLPTLGAEQAIISGSLDQYDAIFIPGGHGPIISLFRNPDLGRILLHFHAVGRMTTAICHGPATFAAASFGTGVTPWPYAGYEMVVFSTVLDKKVEDLLGGTIPFYPEDLLQWLGIKDQDSLVAPGAPHAVYDREVVTGQNPMSATVFADMWLSRHGVMCPPPNEVSNLRAGGAKGVLRRNLRLP